MAEPVPLEIRFAYVLIDTPSPLLLTPPPYPPISFVILLLLRRATQKRFHTSFIIEYLKTYLNILSLKINSISLSLYIFLYVDLSVYFTYLFLSLSVSLYLYLSIYLSPSLSLSISLGLSIYLSRRKVSKFLLPAAVYCGPMRGRRLGTNWSMVMIDVYTWCSKIHVDNNHIIIVFKKHLYKLWFM